MLSISFCSFAEELKFLTGGKYVNGECRNGKYVNDQCVRKVRIWGKWVTEKYYNKILRPLKEFKVGKKYCLYGTKNWDEACQDAAFEYAFGENWQEFKRVALEFIEGVKNKDEGSLEKFFALPCTIAVSNVVHDDGSIGYRPHDADSSEALRDVISNWVLFSSDYGWEYKYTDLYLSDFFEASEYIVVVNEEKSIKFAFSSNCTNLTKDKCFYNPLIEIFWH
jgi:hypothetical protein